MPDPATPDLAIGATPPTTAGTASATPSGSPGASGGSPARPEWVTKMGTDFSLPEKFIAPTPEDAFKKIAAGYTEAEKLIQKQAEEIKLLKGGAPAPAAPKSPVDDLTLGTTAPADEDVDLDTLVARAGLSQADLDKQWLEKGDLTDEQYAKLTGPGRGRKIVRALAEGRAARELIGLGQVQRYLAETVAAVGGDAAHKTLREWAATNLSQQEKDAHNLRLKGDKSRGIPPDPAYYPIMMQAIARQYDAKNGTSPSAGGGIRGTPASSASGGDIGTVQQLRELYARAAAGDKAAQATIDNNREAIAKLRRAM